MKDQNVDLYKYENELLDSGIELICGIDEAGRGSLAGPCVVASCILPPFLRIDGINDSKQLSAKKREELYKIIIKKAIAYKVIFINEKDIDELNIYQATKKGMIDAVNKLKVKPEYVLIDAMPINQIDIPHQSIVHGDALSASIAAASIIAKVERDRFMDKMDIKYPNYGFKHNKGYGTKTHMEAIEKFGPCAIHRKTYEPVASYLLKDRQIKFDF